MKTIKCKIPAIIVIVIILTGLQVSAQSYSTGGYQGGTHGNIKYTLWTGAEDDDWAEPGNWCPALVPDADENVVIPADATVMPEVKSAGLGCKSLTLQPGAEVRVKDGFVLTVNGKDLE